MESEDNYEMESDSGSSLPRENESFESDADAEETDWESEDSLQGSSSTTYSSESTVGASLQSKAKDDDDDTVKTIEPLLCGNSELYLQALNGTSVECRNTNVKKDLDGYLFEGDTWGFIKYKSPIDFDGLGNDVFPISKKANFFKNQPEKLKGHTAILVPLWMRNKDHNMHICVRGKSYSRVKFPPSKKHMQLIKTFIRDLITTELEKLPETTKTRQHLNLNLESNHLPRIYGKTDYDTLANTINSKVIKSKLLACSNVNKIFDPKKTLEVVFISYLTGTKKELEEGKTRMQLETYFCGIDFTKATLGGFHWAWEYIDADPKNPIPDCQVFFNPEKLELALQERLGSSSISNVSKYALAFCKKGDPNTRNYIGNLQCDLNFESAGNNNSIRALNCYKRTSFMEFQGHKLFNSDQNGIAEFLNNNVCQPILVENVMRERPWLPKKEPKKIKGDKKRLLSNSFITTEFECIVAGLHKSLRQNRACRFEVIAEETLGPKTNVAAVINSLNKCHEWIVNMDFIHPEHCMNQVANEGTSGGNEDLISIHQLTKYLFRLYKSKVKDILEKCRNFNQLINIFESDKEIVNANDIVICMVLENCLQYFCKGSFRHTDRGAMENVLDTYSTSDRKDADNLKIQIDGRVLELLKVVNDAAPPEIEKITKILLPKTNLYFHPSVQGLLQLKSKWSELRGKTSGTSCNISLQSFCLSFFKFALLSEWNCLRKAPNKTLIQNYTISFSLHPKEAMTVVSDQDKIGIAYYNDAIAKSEEQVKDVVRKVIVVYHTIDWLVRVFENMRCQLPQRASFPLYNFTKKKLLEKGLEGAVVKNKKWIEHHYNAAMQICVESGVPLVVGSTALSSESSTNFDYELDLDLEPHKPSCSYLASPGLQKKTTPMVKTLCNSLCYRFAVMVPTLDSRHTITTDKLASIYFKAVTLFSPNNISGSHAGLEKTFIRKMSNILSNDEYSKHFKSAKVVVVLLTVLRLMYQRHYPPPSWNGVTEELYETEIEKLEKQFDDIWNEISNEPPSSSTTSANSQKSMWKGLITVLQGCW